jgi:homoserine kinase
MVKVKVPASTSNLGPGFDVFGLALSLNLEVSLEEWEEWLIEVKGEGEEKIPRNERNLVYKGIVSVFEKAGFPPSPFRIVMKNEIPVSRGLGSSGTSILAGAVGANEFLGRPFSLSELVEIAIGIEGHPDNLTASAFGGLTICYRREGSWKWERWEVDSQLGVLIIVPPFPLSTSEARKALPDMISREDAIFNLSRASLLVFSLTSGKWELLKEAMEDRLHQPYRFPLIPEVEKIYQTLKEDEDILGVSLSGAGPSLLIFCLEEKKAFLKEKIEKFCLDKGYNSYKVLSLNISSEGVRAESLT